MFELRALLVDRDGEVLGDLWRDTSGGVMIPRVGEHVNLKGTVAEHVVFKVRWDYELGEIQVFVTPVPTETRGG